MDNYFKNLLESKGYKVVDDSYFNDVGEYMYMLKISNGNPNKDTFVRSGSYYSVRGEVDYIIKNGL